MRVVMTRKELDLELREAAKESGDIPDSLDIRKNADGTFSLFVHLNHWDKEIPITLEG